MTLTLATEYQDKLKRSGAELRVQWVKNVGWIVFLMQPGKAASVAVRGWLTLGRALDHAFKRMEEGDEQ